MLILHQQREPDKCPACGEIEDIVIVCRHCRHEYDLSSKTSWRNIVIGTTVVILTLFGFTFFAWYLEAGSKYSTYTGTYVEWIVEGISKFIKMLKRLW